MAGFPNPTAIGEAGFMALRRKKARKKSASPRRGKKTSKKSASRKKATKKRAQKGIEKGLKFRVPGGLFGPTPFEMPIEMERTVGAGQEPKPSKKRRAKKPKKRS
jgi:hypothetical protein